MTRARVLGLLLVLAAGYLLAEVAAAAAWTGPAYSWSHDAISELGRVDCGSGPDPACSPRHGLFNAVLVGTGVRVLLALALGLSLLRRMTSRPLAAVAALLVAVHGTGSVLVGFFPLASAGPGSAGTGPGHLLGAVMSIVGGVLALAALAVVLRPRHRLASLLAAALGLVGAVASALILLDGVPFGAAERVAVDAPVLWQTVVGLALLLVPARLRWGDG